MGAGVLRSPLVGRHNAQNLLGALTTCLCLGLELEAALDGLARVQVVPGRLEPVPNQRGLLVLVDYAHTEDALAAAMSAVREITRGRLWVVFGCGGDRDQGKRPRMGAVVERHADQVVVTSDNPRNEEPLRIIEGVLQGMSSEPALVEPDRAVAIEWALSHAAPGDAVLIAGKGHETTQELGDRRVDFDDRAVARAAMERG